MVEDSAQLREAVSDFFMNRSGGTLTVETAADGDEGMKAVTENTYDLVILDIMLPGPSGYMICKKLREKSDCPIVFLTALGTEDNILLGYEMGADEYMVKPFSQETSDFTLQECRFSSVTTRSNSLRRNTSSSRLCSITSAMFSAGRSCSISCGAWIISEATGS